MTKCEVGWKRGEGVDKVFGSFIFGAGRVGWLRLEQNYMILRCG